MKTWHKVIGVWSVVIVLFVLAEIYVEPKLEQQYRLNSVSYLLYFTRPH